MNYVEWHRCTLLSIPDWRTCLSGLEVRHSSLTCDLEHVYHTFGSSPVPYSYCTVFRLNVIYGRRLMHYWRYLCVTKVIRYQPNIILCFYTHTHTDHPPTHLLVYTCIYLVTVTLCCNVLYIPIRKFKITIVESET